MYKLKTLTNGYLMSSMRSDSNSVFLFQSGLYQARGFYIASDLTERPCLKEIKYCVIYLSQGHNSAEEPKLSRNLYKKFQMWDQRTDQKYLQTRLESL